jgi:hypothetical protein
MLRAWEGLESMVERRDFGMLRALETAVPSLSISERVRFALDTVVAKARRALELLKLTQSSEVWEAKTRLYPASQA